MIVKRHPYFRRRMNLVMMGALAAAALIVGDLASLFGDPHLPKTPGILLGAAVVGSALAYGFWAGNHVRCSECGAACEHHSDERGRGRRVVCRNCGVVWDLGISYNPDSGG